MPRIILVAETGSDVPPSTAEQYDIQLVPMHVTFGDETRDDGTFPSEEVCLYYERTGILPKTSGCSPEDFVKVFDEIHERWPEAQILYLAYSAVTTCSFQSAHVAAEGRDYVSFVDTKVVSCGQTAVVVTMAQMLQQHPEWTIRQATQAATELSGRARMCFTTNDMEYLRAGGRVSNAVALAGKLLGIHPQIELQDGYLVATKKLRGKMIPVATRMITSFVNENHLQRDHLWFIRTPRLGEDVMQAAEDTVRNLGFKGWTWVDSRGVITTHGGPKSMGLAGFVQPGTENAPRNRGL